MKRIVIMALLFGLLSYSNEPKFEEKWGIGTLNINYGHVLDDEPFPYHPTQEEYYKAQLKGAKTSFDVIVLTEDGVPLENATVIGCLVGDPMGNGKDNIVFKKRTDAEGSVHIEGKTGGKIYFHAIKEGWYDSAETVLTFFHLKNISLQDGRWQPYGMTHRLVLRPIRNRIRMYKPGVGFGFRRDFPKTGEPIGLDLFACDWVEPYGKGETADLLLKYDIKEDEDEKLETLTFSFPNPGDGIYRRPCFRGSLYREDYDASRDSSLYESQMVFHRRSEFAIKKGFGGVMKRAETLVSHNDIGDEDFLVLRTRTVLDENGDVVSCHHSKVVGRIAFAGGRLDISWRTNPTPNDTNLEDDPNVRYTLAMAREEARRRAEREEALASVSRTVSGLLAALKDGNTEEALGFFHVWYLAQQEHVREWLSRISPKFASGDMEAEAEPEVFLGRYAAVVPVRIRRAGEKDDFEIRPLCLSLRSGKWGLLVSSEDIYHHLNSLTQGVAHDLEALLPQCEEYAKACRQGGREPSDGEAKSGTEAQARRGERPMTTEADVLEAPANVMSETSRLVSDFIAALRKGDREAAVAAYGDVTPEQSAAVDQWLSKALPFFSSGKVAAAVEPMCWTVHDAAVTPIRQWRPDKPEIFEIEPTCLVRRNGKWCLLPDLENPGAPVNALDETTARAFSRLQEKFNEYKAERKREMH